MFMEVMHLLYAGGATGFILTLSFAVWIIILSAVRKHSQQDKRRNILWNILCFIPLAVALIHCLMFASGSAFLRILPNYLIIYIPAALIALFPILDTRMSRNPVDIRIPLDREAALKIFDGEDYELDWVVEYLSL